MAAVRKLGAGADDRDGRRAGSHGLGGAKHAKPTGRARYAADRRARAPGSSGLGRGLSAMRQQLFHSRPTRVTKLGGAVIDPDPPAWQVMIREAQRPAFGVAVIVGLILAGFGPATPPLLAHGLKTHPAHRLTPHTADRLAPRGPATTAVKLGPPTYPVPPIGDIKLENPDRLGHNPILTNSDEVPKDSPDPKAPIANPDLDAALKELDEQADRDEAWASQHPAPPGPAPSCPLICTDSTSPPPRQGPAPGLGSR